MLFDIILDNLKNPKLSPMTFSSIPAFKWFACFNKENYEEITDSPYEEIFNSSMRPDCEIYVGNFEDSEKTYEILKNFIIDTYQFEDDLEYGPAVSLYDLGEKIGLLTITNIYEFMTIDNEEMGEIIKNNNLIAFEGTNSFGNIILGTHFYIDEEFPSLAKDFLKSQI
jgi:hypothetical protein